MNIVQLKYRNKRGQDFASYEGKLEPTRYRITIYVKRLETLVIRPLGKLIRTD
jgi:hypothetical protein